MAVDDGQLREMAEHRGLKLVKSRKRTPGVGDYGKYGLTDAEGKALLGIDDDGLTATAAEVEAYLRKSAMSTWRQSAETTPDRPASAKKPRPPEPEKEVPIRPRSGSARARRPGRGDDDETTPGQRKAQKARQKPALRLVPKAAPPPEPRPQPTPAPEPVLRVRPAAAGDAEAVAALLARLDGVSLDRAEVAKRLAGARKAKAGMVVAELDAIVGCCGWAVVPTIHRGPLGRLTVLVVDKAHRRAGIGVALLVEAEKALLKAGCRQVEAMSDITINNSHNFFRSLKFEQTSYRFVRALEE